MARYNTGAAAYLQGYGKRLPQRYFRTALEHGGGEVCEVSQREVVISQSWRRTRIDRPPRAAVASLPRQRRAKLVDSLRLSSANLSSTACSINAHPPSVDPLPAATPRLGVRRRLCHAPGTDTRARRSRPASNAPNRPRVNVQFPLVAPPRKSLQRTWKLDHGPYASPV